MQWINLLPWAGSWELPRDYLAWLFLASPSLGTLSAALDRARLIERLRRAGSSFSRRGVAPNPSETSTLQASALEHSFTSVSCRTESGRGWGEADEESSHGDTVSTGLEILFNKHHLI